MKTTKDEDRTILRVNTYVKSQISAKTHAKKTTK